MVVSMGELVKIASTAAPHFGWGQRYVDQLVTASGAIFRAEGIDESDGVIEVDPGAVFGQVQRLTAERTAIGASARTISSYVTAWKRIAGIARAWTGAGRPAADDPFWARVASEMADTRVRRLVGRSRGGGAAASMAALGDHTPTVFNVRCGDGSEARLELPSHMTERDALAVIAVVSQHALRSRQRGGNSTEDSEEGE